jgi:hypothetical protein
VREQVERLVLQLGAPEVGALHVEAGIAEARARMRDTLGAQNADAPPGCPMHRGNGAAPAGADGGLNEVTAGVVESLGHRHAQAPGGVADGEVTAP